MPMTMMTAEHIANEPESGMTLRDYFAAKVLGDVYAYVMSEAKEGSGIFQDPDWRHGIALDAYAMADAMLKAREA